MIKSVWSSSLCLFYVKFCNIMHKVVSPVKCLTFKWLVSNNSWPIKQISLSEVILHLLSVYSS